MGKEKTIMYATIIRKRDQGQKNHDNSKYEGKSQSKLTFICHYDI